jgi:hypothetical protein
MEVVQFKRGLEVYDVATKLMAFGASRSPFPSFKIFNLHICCIFRIFFLDSLNFFLLHANGVIVFHGVWNGIMKQLQTQSSTRLKKKSIAW